MTKMLFSVLLLSTSSIMLFMNHPLSMGLMILIQTLFVCIISGMMVKTYWFSYILFLTFLGGLLVLFIYVTSIASNELFSIPMKMKLFLMITIFWALLLSIINMYNLNWMNLFHNLEMNEFFNFYLFFNNENKMNISKLYNNQTFLLMMMLIIYLFITLVAVVKITNIFFGPLRSMF